MYPNIFWTKWTVKNVFPLYRYVYMHACVCIHTQLILRLKTVFHLKNKKWNVICKLPLLIVVMKRHTIQYFQFLWFWFPTDLSSQLNEIAESSHSFFLAVFSDISLPGSYFWTELLWFCTTLMTSIHSGYRDWVFTANHSLVFKKILRITKEWICKLSVLLLERGVC